MDQIIRQTMRVHWNRLADMGITSEDNTGLQCRGPPRSGFPRFSPKLSKKYFWTLLPMPPENSQKTFRRRHKMWTPPQKTSRTGFLTVFEGFGTRKDTKGRRALRARSPLVAFEVANPSKTLRKPSGGGFLEGFSTFWGGAGGFFEGFLAAFAKLVKRVF